MDELHEISEVRLSWLGQMGLLIKAGDETLCIDYFASNIEGRLVPPPVLAEELNGITAFLGTHNHIDHIDHDAWKIWAKTNPYEFEDYLDAKYGDSILCKIPKIKESIIL